MNKTDMNADSKKVCKVLKIEQENHDTISLYLEGNHEGFQRRRAGQYVSLRIMREDCWSEPHPFTISSAPEDRTLRLTIKRTGEFTSAVSDLRPGSLVGCDGPFGGFCKVIDTKENIVMIAGGVGITPFLSVLRHFRNIHAKNRVKLFWNNKTIHDAYASDELKEMTKELNLRVIHILSREKETDKYFQAETPEVLYVPGHVTGKLLREHIDFRHTSFYLCGPPKMQDSVLGELLACRVDPKSVERESFSY
jgi:predicted ferric reductase